MCALYCLWCCSRELVKPAMTWSSGNASTLTNTSVVCTNFIAFLWTQEDRYTGGRSKEGASGTAAQRRKMGGKMNILM